QEKQNEQEGNKIQEEQKYQEIPKQDKNEQDKGQKQDVEQTLIQALDSDENGLAQVPSSVDEVIVNTMPRTDNVSENNGDIDIVIDDISKLSGEGEKFQE
ncbi:hypothetical protein RFI_24897, partial [Reticulomyxa filosa]